MKKQTYLLLLSVFIALFISSCQKNSSVHSPVSNKSVSIAAREAIHRLGYDTTGVMAYRDGYLVEHDIYLANKTLNDSMALQRNIIIAKTEQYKTWQVILSLPRTLTVSTDPSLSQNFSDATDVAIARYNALGLNLSLQRVSSNGAIQITGSNLGTAPDGSTILGISPGFPDDYGNPASGAIQLNNSYYTPSYDTYILASTIQHEIGHMIGLRHTDYFDRSSCSTTVSNEGQTISGAVLIPGTPSTSDNSSFMLACTPGVDRSFNTNDVIALNYLYGGTVRTVRTIQSNAFPSVFLRLDGRNVTSFISGGGGVVNCQYTASSFERFYITPQGDGTYTIESYATPNVFLRMDATGLSGIGGTVNTQYTAGPYEKFYITHQADGTYAISSSNFSNANLRMDGRGVTSKTANGSGIVNITTSSPGAWESFNISPAL